jgi:hypothetical protein
MTSLAVDVSGLGFNFPWLGNQTNLALPPTGTICDPYSLEDDNVLTPIRYGTAYYKGTVANNSDPIAFAPAQNRELFSDGPGAAANGNTGKQLTNGNALALDDSDTNAFDEGSLVPNSSEWFLIRGMGVRLDAVGTFDAGGVNSEGLWNYSPKRRFYEEPIMQCLSTRIFLSMRYQNTRTENDLGLAVDWPAMGQTSNAADRLALSTPMIGSLMGFTFPWFAGSNCDCNLVNLFADLVEGFNIGSDANGPDAGTLAGETYLARVQVCLYGEVYCVSWLRARVEKAMMDAGIDNPSGAIDSSKELSMAFAQNRSRNLRKLTKSGMRHK